MINTLTPLTPTTVLTTPLPDTPLTLVDLKQEFITMARDVMVDYVNIALGRMTSPTCDKKVAKEVWSLLKELILASPDKLITTHDPALGNPESIIRAVESGTCSIAQGKELLALYQSLSDINNPKLLAGSVAGAQGSGVSLQININRGGGDTDATDTIDTIEHVPDPLA